MKENIIRMIGQSIKIFFIKQNFIKIYVASQRLFALFVH